MAILRNKETVEILKDLVETITLKVSGKDGAVWVDNLDGTYTLEVCKTYWFTVGDRFEDSVLLGIYHTITEVVKDTSITISSSMLPTNNEATLPTPLFYHGTIIAGTNELTNIRNHETESKPIIYLLEQFDETYFNEESSYDRISNLRLFFLLDSSYSWETPEHYTKVINPIRTLVNYFIDTVIKGNKLFDSEEIQEIDTTTRVRFGVYTSDRGTLVKALNEDYSGIEIRFSLPMFKPNVCCGDTIEYATCREARFDVKNLEGTLLDSGTIPSGGYKLIEINNISCEDATAELYFDGELIDTLTIPAGDTDSFNINCSTPLNAVKVVAGEIGHSHGGTFVLNGTVNDKDSYVKSDDEDRIIYYDGTRWVLEKLGGGSHTHEAALGNEDYPWQADWSGEDLTMTQANIGTYCSNGCEDATYVLKDTDGNILSTGNIASGDSEDIIAPDAVVENSDASYSTTVLSGGTLVLPNTDIDVNGVNEGAIPSVQAVDIQLTDGVSTVTPNDVTVSGNTVTIEVPAGGAAPVGATLMRTGQTTIYRTGDDADTRAEGRATDFFTLASNNPFGNTNRFTDELGGQTYTDDIVIDWSTFDGTTVLGYRRTMNGVNINWNDAIDEALAVSIGSFTTGWRLPNVNELSVLINWSVIRPLEYAPFFVSAPAGVGTFTGSLHSSTTNPNTTTAAYRLNNNHLFTSLTKTTVATGGRYIPCRKFTWNGSVLT
jgi:hypothetical protein